MVATQHRALGAPSLASPAGHAHAIRSRACFGRRGQCVAAAAAAAEARWAPPEPRRLEVGQQLLCLARALQSAAAPVQQQLSRTSFVQRCELPRNTAQPGTLPVLRQSPDLNPHTGRPPPAPLPAACWRCGRSGGSGRCSARRRPPPSPLPTWDKTTSSWSASAAGLWRSSSRFSRSASRRGSGTCGRLWTPAAPPPPTPPCAR